MKILKSSIIKQTSITLILITLILLSVLTTSVQAYVPKEYQNKPYMTDYDIYMVSKDNTDKHWAYDNMRQLMQIYTNNGKCLSCLDAKMKFYDNILKQKVKAVQKLPDIPKRPSKK